MAREPPRLRPLQLDDRERLIRLYHRASRESLYKRFFATPPPEPPEFMLDWLVTVDHTMREAVAAVQGDEIVGVARFDRDLDDPSRAEFAVLVDDALQRTGLGRRLMNELISIARERGVTTLYGLTLPTNRALLGLVRAVADDVEASFGDGVVTVMFEVPPDRPDQPEPAG